MSSGDQTSACPPRPFLHYTAERGWINDPHGVTFRNGLFHLFHQAVPDADRWQPWCSWGHATSPDLVAWKQRAPALSPGDGDYGCWSGSVCVEPAGSPPTLYYTSASADDMDLAAVRSARPLDDDWSTWEKGSVLVRAPAQDALAVFRDPNVFWDDDCWRMLVGVGHEDGAGGVVSFTSTDREQWRYDGPLVEGPGPPTPVPARQVVWECPQFVRIGDRHVLLVSVWGDGHGHYAAAAVGSYRGGRMTVDSWSRLTHGPGHYAPSTFLDEAGQVCVLFWIRDVADPAGRWRGALSIPYRLSLAGDRVHLAPHPNLRAARPDPRRTLGFSWRPRRGRIDQLSVAAVDGSPVLDLIAGGDTLMVDAGGATVTSPLRGGDHDVVVDVLVDGNVLEVMTGDVVLGLQVPTGADLAGPPAGVTSWWT